MVQDVVPAEEEKWSVDPWAAVVKEGRIYGRGTQDMKSVGAQYFDAIVRVPQCSMCSMLLWL